MTNLVRIVGVLCLMALVSLGSDINPGYTFSSGEHNVTHTKLNNLVDAATINTSFITGKSVGVPVAADSFLYFSASAGAFRRATYDSLLLSQTNIIFAQVELNTPQTNDYVLVQTAAGTLAKSSLNALTWTNADLIANRTNWDTPNFGTTYFLGYDSGAYSKISRLALFYNASTIFSFTNLASRATPLNNDALLLWDSTDGTNTQTTLAGLVTNSPAASALAPGDVLWGYSTNGASIRKFTGLQVSPQRSTFANIPVPASNTIFTNTHGLPGLPQLLRGVLVCTNANHGYSPGDEIDTAGLDAFGSAPVICLFADSAKTYLSFAAGGLGIQICNRTNTGTFTMTSGAASATDWNFKVYSTYFP